MIDLLVVGAGPTGLTAAAEAARRGLSVRIVDAAARSPYSKALVLHSRTLELFRQMGLVQGVLAAGEDFRALHVTRPGGASTRVDFGALDWGDAPYPFWLSLPQTDTERLLEAHLNRLGVQVERHTRLSALSQTPEGVQATLLRPDSAEEHVQAAWLIGADGARSTVRKLCGIAFRGTAENEVFLVADVRLDWDRPAQEGHAFASPDGLLLIVPMPGPARYRLIAHLPGAEAGQTAAFSLESLQALVDPRTGTRTRLGELGWQSQFAAKHLVAERYRQGRVYLAGDAAHIHSPVGGQGLNTGIQDAFNLAWKLALVQRGHGTPALLDSYAAERHQIATRVIGGVRAATRLVTLRRPLLGAVKSALAPRLLRLPAIRQRLGRGVGMLDLRYRPSPVLREDWTGPGGPRPGERAPLTPQLQKALQGTAHTLLLLGSSGAAPHLALADVQRAMRDYGDLIRPVLVSHKRPADWPGEVLLDTEGAVLTRYAARQAALYLIRPDGHVAYRNQPASLEALRAYLDRVLIPVGCSPLSLGAAAD